MSAIPITQTTSQSDAGRMVSFRLDAAVFGQLQAAAKRRNLTISAYCRDLVTASIESKREEGTADVYRVAFKTLEEVQVIRTALIASMKVIFPENYNAQIPLSPAEMKLPAEEQDKLFRDPKRKAGYVFGEKVIEAHQSKRSKALASLQVD